jgi:SAM-dependent methyltransferase
MQMESWRDLIPPAHITPCGHLTDTPEKFYRSACEDADRLTRDIGFTADTRILDIGCGVGRLPIGLLGRKLPFAFYLGTDVSKVRIDWCVDALSKADGRLHFQFLDIHNERYNPGGTAAPVIPLPPGSVDVVNLYSVFSHLLEADTRAYLAQIADVLRPGGQCFLTMFVGDNVPSVTENPADFAPLPWSGPLHCVRYNGGYWRQMVQDAGLSVLRDIPLINVDGQTAFYLQKPRGRLLGLRSMFRRRGPSAKT